MATINDFVAFCEEQARKVYSQEQNTVTERISQRQRDTIENRSPKRYYKVREVAKIASVNYGIDIGQNRLYKKMREWGMIIPHTNEPYQSSVDNGYLVYLAHTVGTPYGDKVVMWTKVTTKGMSYILNKLREI